MAWKKQMLPFWWAFFTQRVNIKKTHFRKMCFKCGFISIKSKWRCRELNFNIYIIRGGTCAAIFVSFFKMVVKLKLEKKELKKLALGQHMQVFCALFTNSPNQNYKWHFKMKTHTFKKKFGRGVEKSLYKMANYTF